MRLDRAIDAPLAEPTSRAPDRASGREQPEPSAARGPTRHLRPPHVDTVLFDLDGTLLDTAPDLIGAANDLLAEQGLPALAPGLYAPVVSHGSAAMIARSFDLAADDPRMQPLRQRFLALYRDRVSRLTRPFDGVPELLDRIDDAGLRWGVVTNKPAWLTEPLLTDLDLTRRAGCIVSGDTVPCRKPDPRPILHACGLMDVDPGRTVVVGDAHRDVHAGRLAGTMTIVALFGYLCAEDTPTFWGADGLIGHPGELLRWLVPAFTPPERPSHR
ncbi:HAD-IA family hydrolase [Aquisalimonas lutea]|uniref:HAD-IA family hydrolase n=1 Tax=Aquisalimonas lutea TaxID=1327750 RepID=UPI0025B4E083|nr:HAD-IA family hydrolase [Aquisalimonas lutea]MDN3517665.1 HAD-IA family hydrolase [Aquisalimonas lutea]